MPESLIRTPYSRGGRIAHLDRVGEDARCRKSPPTIAVEFVSAGKRDFQRDYLQKRDEYLATGLAEYWIIDRFRRRMTAIRNQVGRASETVVPEDGCYTTPLLPGFELPLAKLLARADALEQVKSSDDDTR